MGRTPVLEHNSNGGNTRRKGKNDGTTKKDLEEMEERIRKEHETEVDWELETQWNLRIEEEIELEAMREAMRQHLTEEEVRYLENNKGRREREEEADSEDYVPTEIATEIDQTEPTEIDPEREEDELDEEINFLYRLELR